MWAPRGLLRKSQLRSASLSDTRRVCTAHLTRVREAAFLTATLQTQRLHENTGKSLILYETRGTPPCETSFTTGLLSDVCCTALGERSRLTPCPCLTATRNFGARPPAPRTACKGPLPLAWHVWVRCGALRCSLLSALRATLEITGWVHTPRQELTAKTSGQWTGPRKQTSHVNK